MEQDPSQNQSGNDVTRLVLGNTVELRTETLQQDIRPSQAPKPIVINAGVAAAFESWFAGGHTRLYYKELVKLVSGQSTVPLSHFKIIKDEAIKIKQAGIAVYRKGEGKGYFEAPTEPIAAKRKVIRVDRPLFPDLQSERRLSLDQMISGALGNQAPLPTKLRRRRGSNKHRNGLS